MLAFDENYKLVEFASHPNFCVCTSCHRLYSRFVSKQLEGHREKEEDRCPYCNHFNGSSMEDEYCMIEDERQKVVRKVGDILKRDKFNVQRLDDLSLIHI